MVRRLEKHLLVAAGVYLLHWSVDPLWHANRLRNPRRSLSAHHRVSRHLHLCHRGNPERCYDASCPESRPVGNLWTKKEDWVESGGDEHHGMRDWRQWSRFAHQGGGEGGDEGGEGEWCFPMAAMLNDYLEVCVEVVWMKAARLGSELAVETMYSQVPLYCSLALSVRLVYCNDQGRVLIGADNLRMWQRSRPETRTVGCLGLCLSRWLGCIVSCSHDLCLPALTTTQPGALAHLKL